MRKTYTQNDVTLLQELLSKMPEVKKTSGLSLREVVVLLQDDLLVLLTRGYSVKQIAESLKGHGFDIATPTLRSYLTELQKSKKTTEKPRRQRRAPKSPPVGAESVPSRIRPDRERL